MKLQKFISELWLTHSVHSTTTSIRIDGEEIIGFEVHGFSKSGSVILYEKNNKIFAKARYDEITEITNFDDLVDLAWDWYDRYSDREPFKEPSGTWSHHFFERGWLQTKTETKWVKSNNRINKGNDLPF